MINQSSVLSSDWHLERYAWARYPTLSGDSYFGLSQIVDYCVEHELPLIGAGDLFNEAHPDSMPVWAAVQQMDRMASRKLPVYYIQGQHEHVREKPWLSLHEWPQHVHLKTFLIGSGIKCFGLDYTKPDLVLQRLATIPEGTDILVAHQVWRDVMGLMVGPECALADVPHVRMIVSGDFHKHMVFDGVGKSSQKVKFVSPGSICLQSITEPAEKKFFVLNDDLTVTSVPLKSRDLFPYIIENEDQLQSFCDTAATEIYLQEEVPPEIAKPIVYVRFNSDIEQISEKITKSIAGRAHLFLAPLRVQANATMTPTTMDRTALNKGLIGCLDRVLAPTTPEYHVAQRLLSGKDPLATLKELEEEFFEKKG